MLADGPYLQIIEQPKQVSALHLENLCNTYVSVFSCE